MFAHPHFKDKTITRVAPKLDTGPGMTKQAHKKETDINLIMSKYQKTGVLAWASKEAPEYMQVQAIDFQTAMQTVVEANEMFSELPAEYRKQFNNNPEEFLDFVHDPKNEDQMVEMGLATRKVDPGPDKVEGTPDDKVIIDKTPDAPPSTP